MTDNKLDSNVLSQKRFHLNDFTKEFIAGTVAGWAQVTVGHPFDTVKVRIQTQSATNTQFKGVTDCLVKTVKNEGFLGLFKGITSPLLGIGFCNAIIFSVNGHFRRLLNPIKNDKRDILSVENSALAGALSGGINSILVGPIELLKVKFQIETKKSKHNGLLDCCKDIVKTSGVKGLSRGFVSTVLREVPGYAGFFGTYSGLKNLYYNNFESFAVPKPDSILPTPPNWYLIMSGSLSGIACWLCSYPQDVIKSRIQSSSSTIPPTIRETIRTIYQESSARGFFKGLTPCLLRSIPAAGSTFFVYEIVVKLLKDY